MTLPLLALVAGSTDTRNLAPLVTAMRPWCRPHAIDAGLGEADAVLSAAVDGPVLARALRGPAPVAVVVDEFATRPADVVDRAAVFVTRDPATTAALGDRAIEVPRDAVRASHHPPLTPFVRSRWRLRLGLPETMILRLGIPEPWSGPADTTAGALAVCSAAIVRGSWLLTALALGTPVVTDAADAARVGAVDRIHLTVSTPTAFDDDAEALASEPRRATALGWGGRRLVEEAHDLDEFARRVLEALDIGPAPFPVAPLATLDEELAALGTPASSPVATRAIRRAAAIAGPADWPTLTGRRR
ncbi:MAG: glycosyltransferase [Acidimicrobiia bacterium]